MDVDIGVDIYFLRVRIVLARIFLYLGGRKNEKNINCSYGSHLTSWLSIYDKEK